MTAEIERTGSIDLRGSTYDRPFILLLPARLTVAEFLLMRPSTKGLFALLKKVRHTVRGSEHNVLMPDHFYAFVAVDDEKVSLSQWMKSVKNALSKTMRSKTISPPHWQKTFFDHVLRSAESYTEKWNYVRENPVRAGLVNRWEDWPFQGEIFALEYRSEV